MTASQQNLPKIVSRWRPSLRTFRRSLLLLGHMIAHTGRGRTFATDSDRKRHQKSTMHINEQTFGSGSNTLEMIKPKEIGPFDIAGNELLVYDAQAIPEEAPEPLSYYLELISLDELLDPIPDCRPQSLDLDLRRLDGLGPPTPEVAPQ